MSRHDRSAILQAVAKSHSATSISSKIPGRQVFSKRKITKVVGLSGENAILLDKVLSSAPAKTVVIALDSPYLIAADVPRDR